MYLRVVICCVTGLAPILLCACSPQGVTCTSQETIEAVKRAAIDRAKTMDGFGDVDAGRSTADVLDIKDLKRYPYQASCTATLSQHLRFAAGHKPDAAERNFTLPIEYEAQRSDKGIKVDIYGTIVPPDLCTFLTRYTKDPRQALRTEWVPVRTAVFDVKHTPSGLFCSASDLGAETSSTYLTSCSSRQHDPYFIMPNTWETLDKDAAACLSADKFERIKDEPTHKEWSKTYDASRKVNVSWKQADETYSLELLYTGPK